MVHADQKSVLENETYKILCNFEAQTDPPNPVQKDQDLVIINKKKNENQQSSRLCRPGKP